MEATSKSPIGPVSKYSCKLPWMKNLAHAILNATEPVPIRSLVSESPKDMFELGEILGLFLSVFTVSVRVQ